jgi:oligo-1,6-glucosidase
VEARQQYYLHLFDYRQPDLNWELPEVRQTIYNEAIRFWLDRGIDGFRVDTCAIYSKDQRFPDGKTEDKGMWEKFGNPFPHVAIGPRIHEFWQEIRREALDAYGDVLMIGELGGDQSRDNISKFADAERKEMSCVFSFELTSMDGLQMQNGFENIRSGRHYTAQDMRKAVEENESVMMEKGKQGWVTVFTENHDVARSVSRFGDMSEKYRDRSAKLLAMLVCCLSGSLTMYQGQEIAMQNIPSSWNVDDLMDLVSIEYYENIKKQNPGDHKLLSRVWEGIVAVSRDNARTPMQWTEEKYGGFCKDEKPWMRVNDNYTSVNVAAQSQSRDSVLSLWQKMLRLRKKYQDVLIQGSYKTLDVGGPDVFAFEKTASGRRVIVVLNPSDKEVECHLQGHTSWSELISTVAGSADGKSLKPWQGVVFQES